MKNILSKSLVFVAMLAVLYSCKDNDTKNNKEQDQQELIKLHKEIVGIATEYSCDNASEWKFVAIGEKACGGPTNYIAYSRKSNEKEFLNKVSAYTTKQKAYNVKYDVASDCMFVTPPKSVECVDNKPKFVY